MLENIELTRKSSCVNARGIPTAVYQVLHLLTEVRYTSPTLRLRYHPLQVWWGVPKVGYPLSGYSPVGVPQIRVPPLGYYPHQGTPHWGSLPLSTPVGIPPLQDTPSWTWLGYHHRLDLAWVLPPPQLHLVWTDWKHYLIFCTCRAKYATKASVKQKTRVFLLVPWTNSV